MFAAAGLERIPQMPKCYMTKCKLIWTGGILGLILFAVVFDPTHILRGLLANESFFLKRPTSYWRNAIKSKHPDIHRSFGVEFGAEPTNVAAVPVLVQLLEDEDDEVRAFACNVLVGLRTDAKPAVPVLLKLLKHPELFDRRRAAWVLAAAVSSEQAMEATPHLIEALKEEDAWVNYHSAIALGRMSNRAMHPWMKGVKETVGDAASWALTAIESARLEKGEGP
jgi:HEAT repeat protein